MADFIILIILFTIFICIFLFFKLKSVRKDYKEEYQRFIKDRTKLDPIVILEKMENKDIFDKGIHITIFNSLYNDLGEDFKGYLRVEDNFSNNLSFLFKYDDWLDIDLLESIEKKFNIRFNDDEAKNLKSIEDIILAVQKKV